MGSDEGAEEQKERKRDRVRSGGGGEWRRGRGRREGEGSNRFLPFTSSMPESLFLSNAWASDLFPLITIDVFQLYPWHFWQYVCKHKAFSDLASCHLAQELSFITAYQLSIEGVSKGATYPWPWPCLFFCFLFFFCPRVSTPHSLPSGVKETFLFKGEKTGWKQGNSFTWGHIVATVDNCALGQGWGDIVQNPEPISLAWAWL